VLPELILPPGQFLLVAYGVLGAQPLVCCQWDEGQVHMGRFLIHMDHSGDDGIFRLMLFYEVPGFLKVSPDLGLFLSLEELRAGGHQGFHHPHTVLAGAASSGGNLPLRLGPVLPFRLYQMEV